MEKKLNELVERLTKEQDVECSRPSKTAQALKDCIDRDYVHIMFKATGTEVGVALTPAACNWQSGDFTNAKGTISLSGGLTLNYNRVKCVANIDLSTCEGTAHLVPVDEEEYHKIMGNQLSK